MDYDDIDEIDFSSTEIDEKQAALEEMAAQTLLVELFNAKKAEVFENVVFEDTISRILLSVTIY